MNQLQSFLHGIARAFTAPHADRVHIAEALSKNPAALLAVNALKDNLTLALVHAATPSHADPLTAALEAIAISQQIERAFPTPPTPDTGGAAPKSPAPPAVIPPTQGGVAPSFPLPPPGSIPLSVPPGGSA